jgi:hypothetical protein
MGQWSQRPKEVLGRAKAVELLSGMRRFFSFWWVCIKDAARGSADFANDWQWLFGFPVVLGVISGASADKMNAAHPIAFGFLTALGAFVVTWLVSFFVRLLNAPVRLYNAEKDRADALARAASASSFAAERAEFVDKALSGLPVQSIAMLRGMLISGRPTQPTDDAWKPLEDAGLVERDFTGPNGIKEEFRAIIEDRLGKQGRATLGLSGPHLHHGNDPLVNRWRMTVHNSGPVSAGNVQMRLRDIEPRPSYATWLADYPYSVTRVGATGHSECKINPNDDEVYEVIAGWKNGEGNIFGEGLDTKTTSHKNYIGIEPDEHWELKYEVTAENADVIQFSLVMRIVEGAVVVERKA